jgi:16S rRNA C967 or C1407 C5-methylase (RsmB/RsmF family)
MLEFNLARHGSTRYVISSLDPDEMARRLPAEFDAVLVDAPCSGQSLVGRGKQTASAFAPNTIEHCAARQVRILDAAASLVRPGGRLVYSTCTFAYAENEGQIESFLQRHSEWQLAPNDTRLAANCGGTVEQIGLRL